MDFKKYTLNKTNNIKNKLLSLAYFALISGKLKFLLPPNTYSKLAVIGRKVKFMNHMQITLFCKKNASTL